MNIMRKAGRQLRVQRLVMPTRAMIQDTKSGSRKWPNTADALRCPNAHAPECVLAVCATTCTGMTHTTRQMRTNRHNAPLERSGAKNQDA